MNPHGRVTVGTDGAACCFPLLYGDSSFDDCVSIAGASYCRTVPSIENSTGAVTQPRLVECEDKGTRDVEQQAPGSATSAAAGSNSSSASSGTGECSNTQGRVTEEEEQCCFPLRYNGQEYDDCVPVNGQELCRTTPSGETSDSETERLSICQPKGPANGTDSVGQQACENVHGRVVEADGSQCCFPMLYLGQEYEDCMPLAGTEFCRSADSADSHGHEGGLVECSPRGANATEAATMSASNQEEAVASQRVGSTPSSSSSSDAGGTSTGLIVGLAVGLSVAAVGVAGLVAAAVVMIGRRRATRFEKYSDEAAAATSTTAA